MYQEMSTDELRTECWKQDLEDHGEHHDLVSRLTTAYSQLPDDTSGSQGTRRRNSKSRGAGHGSQEVPQ